MCGGHLPTVGEKEKKHNIVVLYGVHSPLRDGEVITEVDRRDLWFYAPGLDISTELDPDSRTDV